MNMTRILGILLSNLKMARKKKKAAAFTQVGKKETSENNFTHIFKIMFYSNWGLRMIEHD